MGSNSNRLVFDDSEKERGEELDRFDETKEGVRGLTRVGLAKLPKIFILPKEHQVRSTPTSFLRVPIIDLEGFKGGRRGYAVGEIRKACQTWGIFQVINHGVPKKVVDAMLDGTLRFHEQPKESKAQFYTRDPHKMVSYRATIHPLLKTALWKDTLVCKFEEDSASNPEVPLVCREAMYNYMDHIISFKNTLSELLSEALGLERDRLARAGCMESQKLAAHYYPPCPEPHLTLGSPRHADPYFLTVITQRVDGLQALHQDQWADVPALEGALVVILGDMMQIISNDLFKSAEHRVVSGEVETRVSVASFFYPSARNVNTKYGVIADELVSESNPATYGEISLGEYLKFFGANGIVGSKALEHLRQSREDQ